MLTIDPARRLAQSMGLTELDNTPREVVGQPGLFAMMLDMKRTFDDVVLEHSTPDRAEQIFANPFYQSLSSSFAGTQEYMAMEKLGQLVSADEWDLIVVDTPPSRSALDFLDAPNRLGRFLDGRMIRVLTAPARAGGKAYLKVVTVSVGVLARVFTKVLGGELLRDLSSFVSALESMFGGFRERAQHTYELLKEPGTAFIVVATPSPTPCARRPSSSNASPTSGCPWPGWWSTGCTAPRWATPRCRPPAPRPRPTPWPPNPTIRPPGWPRRRCGCTPSSRPRPSTTCA